MARPWTPATAAASPPISAAFSVLSGNGSEIGGYEADPNLRFATAQKSGSDFQLNYYTLFGRTYRIDAETNLDNSWVTLTNNIPGTGGILQWVDVGGASQPRRFYRAVQMP